ncbi:MAG: SCO1664 family protein [Ilumatobacteraceae bacterium]|nr:SCO1664 family protein [Ilumatobacteraceae bacterium]
MSANELVGHDNPIALLAGGEIEVVGRMPWSSNATFLVKVTDESGGAQAIYKPLRGERPLWDFEPGLHRREVAAYELSEAMGFDDVPPTVLRDGPMGEGSLQWFIEADPNVHYFTMFEGRDDLHEQLKTMAVFDIVANNTDRKGGHVLVDANDHVWGIDHGVCFSADFKLRTVIWDFATENLTPHHKAALEQVASQVPLRVAALLDDDEVQAIRQRARWLLEAGVLPYDPSGRRVPWPLV